MAETVKQGLMYCAPFAECSECPYYSNGCYVTLHSDALKIIKQQEQIIEKLTKENRNCLQNVSVNESNEVDDD